MNFKNKTVVVTGGASGIGKTICDEFRKSGANVCVIDLRKNDYFVGDIADENTLHSFAEKVIGDYRNIDYLINNAMLSKGGIMDCSYSLSPNGSESVVFEFEAGSIIGANLLFGNQNRYLMNIYCTADSFLFQISTTGIRELLKEYGFVMQFVKSLSMNSQGMNRKIAMYTQKSLRENLMDYLLALSTRQKSNTVVLTVTKKQLADYFGVQRPSLFRELKRMKDEGLIEIENKRITIMWLNE